MLTPYGEKLNPSRVLRDYPRPQLMRDSYLCLNGSWEYAITKGNSPPESWDGEIIVPFPPESLLSGVVRVTQPQETLWYRRTVSLPAGFVQGRLLLHFGGVDQCCQVYLDGGEAGRHDGGYLPFTLDITGLAANKESFELRLMVIDETDTAPYSRGRQKLGHGGSWHTPMSGIWQTVWLESVPEQYIANVTITPLFDEAAVEFCVKGNGEPQKGTIQVYAGKYPVVEGTFEQDKPLRLELPGALSWSPERPFLYTVLAVCGEDRVVSYFGMRKLSRELLPDGTARMMLNNKPFFATGVVDQGMYSDGLYTPPKDDAMLNDLKYAKKCGFNAVRMSGKIAPMRWYYHCDKLGLLVWQDLPGGGEEPRRGFSDILFSSRRRRKDNAYARFGRENAEGRLGFVRDLDAAAALLYNTPSLGVWVLFSDGYGQFDSARLTRRMREKDPTRLVDHASGRYDQGAGDFYSLHSPGTPPLLVEEPEGPDGRLLALGEVGGFGLVAEGHFTGNQPAAPVMVADGARLADRVADLYQMQILPLVKKGLCAVFYCQLTDAEDEVTGLLTADRRAQKLSPALLAPLNEQLRQAARQGRE